MKIESYFEKSPVFQIIYHGRKAETFVNKSLEAMGLSYFQALILVALHVEDNKDVLVGDLVKIFPLTKGAISQAISVLEEKKMLKRETSQDRRSSFVQITKRGGEIALKAQSLLEKHEQRFDTLVDSKTLTKLKQLTY